jgi:membrane fusion protein (multidrug efflux system)
VVNAQNVVEQRQLTILQDHGQCTGSSARGCPGDRIVVEGVQKIGVGMTVAPEERKAPEAPADGMQRPPKPPARSRPEAAQPKPPPRAEGAAPPKARGRRPRRRTGRRKPATDAAN